MNSLAKTALSSGESCQTPPIRVALIDKAGLIRWHSSDPLGSAETAVAVVSLAPEDEQPRLLAHLSRAMLLSERQRFTMPFHPWPGGGEVKQFLVELMPATGTVTIGLVAFSRELPDYWSQITDDDREILSLLCDDKTLKDVGHELHLSESAIDTRIRKLKTKLGVENIGGLVATAVRNFLV